MAALVKSLVEERILKTESPFFIGNLVTYHGKVVLVTGNGSAKEYFAGVVIGGSDNIGIPSDAFIRHYWKQFEGKVTLEATR